MFPHLHAPNRYPYSMPLPTNVTEANALDTSGDGDLTVADSPFSPYWPGDEYVDWVGLSVYYKGPNSQNINVLQPRGYCYGALSNYNPNTGLSAPDPWYETYCLGKPNVACMFAESGVAYHDMILGDQGVSDFALKQQWWEDCLVGRVNYLVWIRFIGKLTGNDYNALQTNTSFLEEFPRLKLMMQFEYEKNETDSGITDHRDYRLTNGTDVLDGFKSALDAMTGEVYTWWVCTLSTLRTEYRVRREDC